MTVGRRSSQSRTVAAASSDDIPAATRRYVLKRDGHRCRFCGATKRLHVHHARYRSEGIDHSPQNLLTLCLLHHDLVHSSKRTWKPVCLAYIWLITVERRSLTLPQVKKLCDSLTSS